MTTIRCALTQTRNAFGPMPRSVGELGQLAGRLDEVRDANLAHHAELAAAAAGAGARVLGLGELFAAPYFALHRDPLWLELAEDACAGPTVRFAREIAARHGLIVVAPIYELDAASGRRFNTAVVVDERATVLGKYRKTHVPAGANERAAFDERYYYDPGDGKLGNGPADVSGDPHFPVFRTSLGPLGVAICYDRHFEGVMRALARGGAALVLCPAVTFGAKSRRLWAQEAAVDAARHRIVIGVSNRVGSEPPWGVEYFGESAFFGPEGPLPTLDVHPNLVVADVDLDALGAPDPAGWDLARHARPELFERPDRAP